MADLALDGLDTGRSAQLSRCGLYRYTLTRSWGDGLALAWCALNPSTADAMVDDPTVRRMISFTRAAGYRRLVLVNAFGYRSTDPDALDELPYEVAVGPGNDAAIRAVGTDAGAVVCAWGASGGRHLARRVQELAAIFGATPLRCLGLTQGGAPRHPLYVRGDQALVEYRP